MRGAGWARMSPAGALTAQANTPSTWLSLKIPVPSIPMEKLSVAVSPSASAIWTLKSSF